MGRGVAAWAVAGVIAGMAMGAPRAPAGDPPKPPAKSAEEEWEARITDQLARLEMELGALDKKKADTTQRLHRRIADAHGRVLVLEKSSLLAPGSIRGEWDLATMTTDLAMLHTRVRAVIEARNPKPQSPPASPPAPAPAPKDPEPPAKPDPTRGWPRTLEFTASAKLVYQETGEWLYSKMQRSSLGNDFLMDGYSGTLGFSLSSAGLKQDVVSADVRVVVSQPAPFGYDEDSYWVYDVTWASENGKGVFGNESLKHFPRYDTVATRGPIAWISKPKEVTLRLRVRAFVSAVRLKSGEEITFDVPQLTNRPRGR